MGGGVSPHLRARTDGAYTFAMTTPHILYLDFDGVLHDDAAYCSPDRGMYLDTPGRTLFEWMPILDELLAPYPELRVVLSTS
jgi:hypothetical protein